jgi:DNA-directed RNA polymerase, sigma subunit (sigma70/sigma32)
MHYKDNAGELKIRALEIFLTAVYGRPVKLSELLLSKGIPPDSVSALEYRNMSAVAEQLIAHIRMNFFTNAEYGGERMYEIVERYYGLDGNMPARLAAIATKHGVSRERIRQLKVRALRILGYEEGIAYIEETLTRLASQASNGQSAYCYGEPTRRYALDFTLKNHRELLICSQPRDAATVEQREALNLIDSHNRVRVNGCVGSGKTWLAIETARKLASEGKRTLLTCFNRTLADYLNSVLPPNSNLVIASFHSLCLRLARQTNIPTPGGWNTRAWTSTIPDLIRRSVITSPGLKFDAIVIDDAHELVDSWWYALMSGMTDEQKGQLYFFVDDNLPVAARPMAIPKVDCEARLTTNLRSGDDVEGLLLSTSSRQIRFASRPCQPAEFYRCNTASDIRTTLDNIFLRLEESGMDTSEVAVLTPRLARFSSVSGMKLRGNSRIVKRNSDIPNHAMLSRIQTFHGLERKVIIIVDLDDTNVVKSFSELAQQIYLGFSRHTERLIVLGSHSLWEFLTKLHRSEADFFFMKGHVGVDVPSQAPTW